MLIKLLKSILFWLLLTSSLAFVWPEFGFAFDPFVMSKWLLWSAIFLTMFSLGGLVSPDELKPLRSHPFWVALGVLTQVTVMPLAAWLATKLIPMDEDMALGVLLVGCVPGAMASNVLTNTARGSVAYSVSLTSVATLLSPLTVPGILWVLSGHQSEGFRAQSSLLLATFVTLPTILGYFASARSERFRFVLKSCGPLIASIALLWIITTVVAANRDALQEASLGILLALLAINLAGYLGGYCVGSLSQLPSSYRRALTLEIGMQNAGVGTTLAVSILGSGTVATIPTAVYTFGCMLTGTILAVFWQRCDQPTRS